MLPRGLSKRSTEAALAVQCHKAMSTLTWRLQAKGKRKHCKQATTYPQNPYAEQPTGLAEQPPQTHQKPKPRHEPQC